MARSKRKLTFFVFFVLVIFVTIMLIYYISFRERNFILGNTHQYKTTISGLVNNEVFITVVACGPRLEETLTMIKSALIFNKMTTFINFKIFCEEVLKESFKKQLILWQNVLADTFSFQLYSLHFPKAGENAWKTLFKPCAAQRLFLPSLLQNIDATIYVDTDIVFLSPAADIWAHLKHFNASHIAGLSPEHEDLNIGWYNRFARHPFYGKLGLNSGVMLMNLTRMRKFEWENQILPIHQKYGSQITWGDQDLINILFYYHPDKVYIFPCAYNYRPDHCMYMNVCNITHGIRILHGNRGYFHSDKQPLFKKTYQAFNEFDIESVPRLEFSLQLSQALEDFSVKNSTCGKIMNEMKTSGINFPAKR